MPQTTKNNSPRSKPSRHLRWYEEGEMRCVWCGRPSPAGYFGRHKKIYACSGMCAVHHQCRDKKPIRCKLCGKRFVPQNTGKAGRFCGKQHFNEWRRRETDRAKLGAYAPLVYKFLAAVIPNQRAQGSERDLRCNLAHFIVFLRGKGVRSLESVTPRLIAAFFRKISAIRPKSADKTLADLRLLFDWALLAGYRKSKNPARTSIQSIRKEKTLPRPFSSRELQQIDELLDACGDPRLKLAVAIGLEAGLEIGEVCGLKISDIDLNSHSILVRKSNRTGLERTTYFHVRARKALDEWLAVRPDVDHDFLLSGHDGIHMSKHRLRARLNEALCGPDGIGQFEFRRLKQTAGARLAGEVDSMRMMSQFGWRTPGPVEQLKRLPNRAAVAAYADAMQQITDEQHEQPTRQESLDSFFGSESDLVASRVHATATS